MIRSWLAMRKMASLKMMEWCRCYKRYYIWNNNLKSCSKPCFFPQLASTSAKYPVYMFPNPLFTKEKNT